MTPRYELKYTVKHKYNVKQLERYILGVDKRG
jgi:hypothetical protein